MMCRGVQDAPRRSMMRRGAQAGLRRHGVGDVSEVLATSAGRACCARSPAPRRAVPPFGHGHCAHLRCDELVHSMRGRRRAAHRRSVARATGPWPRALLRLHRAADGWEDAWRRAAWLRRPRLWAAGLVVCVARAWPAGRRRRGTQLSDPGPPPRPRWCRRSRGRVVSFFVPSVLFSSRTAPPRAREGTPHSGAAHNNTPPARPGARRGAHVLHRSCCDVWCEVCTYTVVPRG